MQTTCPKCKSQFNCGGCTTNQCWCSTYPAIFSCTGAQSSTTQTGCLCPSCLTIATVQHIKQNIDNVAVHTFAPLQATQCKDMPLIENLDYTVQNGKWVLSRWYLLKQGKCCGNSCQNCPYGHVNVKK